VTSQPFLATEFLLPTREIPARYGRRRFRRTGGGNKVRVLSIPAIRDRVVQGALKLILDPISLTWSWSSVPDFGPARWC